VTSKLGLSSRQTTLIIDLFRDSSLLMELAVNSSPSDFSIIANKLMATTWVYLHCKNRMIVRRENWRRKCVSNFGFIDWFSCHPVLASKYNKKQIRM
jgi:hypothetical protein